MACDPDRAAGPSGLQRGAFLSGADAAAAARGAVDRAASRKKPCRRRPRSGSCARGIGDRPLPILTGLGALYAPFDLEAGLRRLQHRLCLSEVLLAMVAAARAGDWHARSRPLRAIRRAHRLRAAAGRGVPKRDSAAARSDRLGPGAPSGCDDLAAAARQLDDAPGADAAWHRHHAPDSGAGRATVCSGDALAWPTPPSRRRRGIGDPARRVHRRPHAPHRDPAPGAVPVLLYVLNYMDRVNISYAALQMTGDLGFSNTVFGFGAGIFFIGYFLSPDPRARCSPRCGAREVHHAQPGRLGSARHAWPVRQTPHSSSTGSASSSASPQAGFFPGVIVYLTHWYRYAGPRQGRGHLHGRHSDLQHDRARRIAAA